MREIKFRAWDKKEKFLFGPELADVFVRSNGEIFENAPVVYNTPNMEIVWTNDYEISQYTGLHDKNGMEIYEGDIVKTRFKDAHVGSVEQDYFLVVEWNQNFSAFAFKKREDIYGTKVLCPQNQYNLEVIGNIYENPELLESEAAE